MSVARASDATSVVGGIALTHPDKLLYAEGHLSKRDLALYYEQVADRLLPHVRNRPLMIVRCPDGWDKACFHQKHADGGVNRAIGRATIKGDESGKGYLLANSADALIALVQMGALELHPWGSTTARPQHADRLIFDLDPDESLAWPQLVEAVKALRGLLAQIGLEGFLKTTGGKGLHVVVPVRPTLGWTEAKEFTKAVAVLLATAHPTRFTTSAAKAGRRNRIYIDYLRNARGATAIAPYSTRARDSAPVAMPIAWSELRSDVRFAHFNVENVPERLRRRKDPWAAFFELDQAVTRTMMRRVAL